MKHKIFDISAEKKICFVEYELTTASDFHNTIALALSLDANDCYLLTDGGMVKLSLFRTTNGALVYPFSEDFKGISLPKNTADALTIVNDFEKKVYHGNKVNSVKRSSFYNDLYKHAMTSIWKSEKVKTFVKWLESTLLNIESGKVDLSDKIPYSFKLSELKKYGEFECSMFFERIRKDSTAFKFVSRANDRKGDEKVSFDYVIDPVNDKVILYFDFRGNKQQSKESADASRKTKNAKVETSGKLSATHTTNAKKANTNN